MERFDCGKAQEVAKTIFGIVGAATELGGERTQNFKITDEDGGVYTLKVSDPAEDVKLLELESAVLSFLEGKALAIGLPRVLRSLDNRLLVPVSDLDNRCLRLFSFLAGTPFSEDETQSSELCANLGRTVAVLDNALREFDHPSARDRDLIWDVKNISRIRPYLDLLVGERKALAESMLDHFEAEVQPLMSKLPSQVVHADINRQNIIVDANNPNEVAGIIDFGDSVYAPRVVDLSGAASLQFNGKDSNLADACDLVLAYSEVCALDELEIDLLVDFMIARSLINVAVTEYLARKDPEKRDYIMKNNPVSWVRLDQINRLSKQKIRHAFRRAAKGISL